MGTKSRMKTSDAQCAATTHAGARCKRLALEGSPTCWAHGDPPPDIVIPRCTAMSKQTHRRCSQAAIPGTNVCKHHGGGNPQVKRKAALRLAALVDPAIGTLAREMVKADRSSDRQRAANSILDRAGIVRQGAGETDTARALLLERLRELTERARGDGAVEDIVDAEVVTDDEADEDEETGS